MVNGHNIKLKVKDTEEKFRNVQERWLETAEQ
jgi:hypothetical protein